MPDMDGFEVAGHLKVEPEQAEIPIIFLTALNDSASVVKGFQLGANDFISKPFRREELLIRVEHQLSLVDARRVILRQTEELRKTIAGRDKLYSVIAHDLRYRWLPSRCCVTDYDEHRPANRSRGRVRDVGNDQ